jgi:hypothetical protein
MKRWIIVVQCVGILSALAVIAPAEGNAGVNINVTIPFPGLVISAPPVMAVIPGTYVYYPPDVNAEIFFYGGSWYCPYRGQWLIAAEYNGPWGSIAIQRVPGVLMNLPSHYRQVPPGSERMPYRMVKRNWRTWENERHWDNHESRRGYADHEGNGYAEPRRGHGMGRGMGMHGNDE